MQDNASVKSKMINLINSVRTLMRSTCYTLLFPGVRREASLGQHVLTAMVVPLIFLNILIIVWAVAFG